MLRLLRADIFPRIDEGKEEMKRIEVDEEVYQELLKHVRSFEDTPNDVLRRLLGLEKKPPKPKTDDAIPLEEYRLPILEALLEKGGRARVREVFEIIERKMGDRFNELDLQVLSDGYKRWQRRVAWQRFIMVNGKDGLLRRDPPKGVWKISEKGWKYLRDAGYDV